MKYKSNTISEVYNYWIYPGLTKVDKTYNGIPPEQIIDRVSRFFGISKEDIKGKSRMREIVEARHSAMYLMKECCYPSLSLDKIGSYFQTGDHATVRHAYINILNRAETEPNFRKKLMNLRAKLNTFQYQD